jgi:hypothetical protein
MTEFGPLFEMSPHSRFTFKKRNGGPNVHKSASPAAIKRFEFKRIYPFLLTQIFCSGSDQPEVLLPTTVLINRLQAA